MEGDSEQFNGREGETAALLSRSSVNSNLREFGFAPRHLSRSAFLVGIRLIVIMIEIIL